MMKVFKGAQVEYSILVYLVTLKFPMLLPNSHFFTKLIIAKSHEQICHNKVQETLTQLRSCFWVIKGRKAMKETDLVWTKLALTIILVNSFLHIHYILVPHLEISFHVNTCNLHFYTSTAF